MDLLLHMLINGFIVILVKAKSENELYELSTTCLKIVKTWLDKKYDRLT